MRARRLRNEPLCRICLENGIATPSTVPDHIVPLALGGKDIDANIRCLCQACHDKVTAEQFNRKQRIEYGLDGWPVRGRD